MSSQDLIGSTETHPDNVECKPVPAEFSTSPDGSTTSGTSAGRNIARDHARTVSIATDASTSHKSNRFSVQFSTSSGRTSISEMREPVPFDADNTTTSFMTVDGSFLTAVAAQERRVLELKEELEKAESVLDHLKQHWAQHEARKKRDDVRRITQLQPLQTSFLPDEKEDDIDGSNAWMRQEMKRRKTLLSGTRSSNRTVFSGSRHTRALSLLSPKDTVQPNSQRQPPPRTDSLRKAGSDVVDAPETRAMVRLPRPSTAAGSFGDLFDQVGQDNSLPNPALDHEAILRQGKKMANNFKDGLWTFWEDLRQATVGEEATNDHVPTRKSSSQTLRAARKQTSRASLRPSSRGSSVSKASTETKRPSPVQPPKAAALPDLADPSFWSEHGMLTQTAAPTPKRKSKPSIQNASPRNRHSLSSNDAWDVWDDSPVDSRTSSIVSEPTTLPSTVSGSPRTSTSTNRDLNDHTRKEPIPWPAMPRVGTSNLRRTMSHLLQEWDNLDKAPTPKPGAESTAHEKHPRTGSESTAAGTAKSRID